MKHLTVIGLLVFASCLCFSQNEQRWLKKKLQQADTVLLVSHKPTEGVTIVDDSTNKPSPRRNIIITGKPNYNVIKERQVVKGADLDTLISILARPMNEPKISLEMCFIPHHTIFMIKNGEASYIDMCFGCHRFKTSKDLSEMDSFNERKWDELYNFFIDRGMKYELIREKE